jgi:predicted nucleic acid-binding protein
VIVLDASVLIAHFESEDSHHQRASALLLDLVAEDLGAHPITIAEVLVGPARTGRVHEAAAALDSLGVQATGSDSFEPQQLATLRASTGCKLPDCCVLAAAIANHASVATLDARLAQAAQALGVAVLP